MIKKLLRVRLGSLFSSALRGKDGRTSPMKIVGFAVLAFILLLSFAAIFLSVAASLAIVLIPAGLDSYYFAIFNLITLTMVFIFSIFETKSELFDCRDNELLLSMPIPPRDIVLSRALSVILLNVGETLIIMIPAIVMYLVFGGALVYVFTSLLISMLFCLLATALASAAGYLVALISARFKNKTFISVALYITFFIVYFISYEGILEGIFLLEEAPDAALGALVAALGPVGVIGEISLFYPLPTLIFVPIAIGVPLIAWLIISKNYVKIITGAKRGAKKKYKKERLTSGSVITALIKKEMSLFFSSAAYILNGASGIIFNVILVFFVIFAGDAVIAELGILSIFGEDFIYLAVTALLSGMAFMNMISASALSLEGKHWWIIKSSPIPARAVVYSKLVPHLMVTVPVSLISSVVLSIVLKAPLTWWIPIVAVPLIANLVSAVLGLVLNIAMPKFEFANEAQVVKQSLPVFICTLLGMLLMFGSVAIALVLTLALGATVSVAIIAAFYLVVFLVLYLILTGPSERRLGKL